MHEKLLPFYRYEVNIFKEGAKHFPELSIFRQLKCSIRREQKNETESIKSGIGKRDYQGLF